MRQRGSNSANKAERTQPLQLNQGIEMSPNKKSPINKRVSPQANSGANTSAGGNSIVAPPSDYYREAKAYVTGALVAVVDTPHGTPRRRVFLTLAAAEKCVLRARMNGHEASFVLCKLVPVNGGEAL